ncbi:P22AR C-terminal domain-containing protein [Escherichia coli]|uniref:P22AR C-terminal domain-containing protein n=1 Tax=Escherichia coli TaxID=562 RepID=UPI0032EFB9A5
MFILTFQNHTNRPLTDFGGKTSIFSHPVYLFLREFSLQDFRGGSIYPGMKQIGSELSGKIYDIAYETRYMSEETKKSLLREMKNLDPNNFVVKNAQPMLAKLRGEEWIH